MIYLDNAATTRVRDEAAAAALAAMQEDFANPSSTHTLGRRAAGIVTKARAAIAKPLGASPAEVIFTSGGTEADNWAILGGAEATRRYGNHIITAKTEHSAAVNSAKHLQTLGFEVTLLAPDAQGRITPEAFAAALRDDTILASVMLVNNETGVINPVAALAELLHGRNKPALFHTDAVQAYGKIPVVARSLGADLVSVSAHKIGGAKGVGALFVRSGVRLPVMLHGGEQEYGRRAGTEPLPAIAAFGEAARLGEIEREASFAHVAELRALAVSELRERLRFLRFITDTDGRGVADGVQSPYILSIALPGYRSEVLMTALEADEIFLSRSSACKKGARSHVLEAMGLPAEVMDGALRVSFSHETTREDVLAFVERLEHAANTIFTRKPMKIHQA